MFLHRFAVAFSIIAVTFSFSNECFADKVPPIALRQWSDGGFTIENQWGLIVGLGVSEEVSSSFDRAVDLDDSDLEIGKGKKIFRAPNEATVETQDNFTLDNLDAICVMRSIAKGGVTETPTLVYASGNLIIDLSRVSADSVRAMGDLAEMKKAGEEFGASPIVIATHASHSGAFCEEIVKAVNPRLMIVRERLEKVGEMDVEAVSHNTVGLSPAFPDGAKVKVISLGTKPYEMSDAVKELFARKEAACADSRAMFAKLSVSQMNFKPANGSHTPRWNAEHMMGRELGFFSEIYNAVDPSIPVMNLNPKQMPEDYEFAHQDWTGAEEARQMKRVQDFTRRFAYLLDGMQLDRKAKGSRFWSPRALLKQMERHYKEHSANVVKKMELDGWPKE